MAGAESNRRVRTLPPSRSDASKMVTRQSSPSLRFRYQALIKPPGPPPTIAKSSMIFPRFPAPLLGTSGLSQNSKSAFQPEGKMNKPSFRTATANKNETAVDSRHPFVPAKEIPGSFLREVR